MTLKNYTTDLFSSLVKKPIQQARCVLNLLANVMARFGKLSIAGGTPRGFDRPDHSARAAYRREGIIFAVKSPYGHIDDGWGHPGITPSTNRNGRRE